MVAAPAMAPRPPPTAAPMPAPCPPPAIAPIIAPVPAPTRPPPTARSAGLYGSAKAVVANINPAPITLAMVDCFVIRFLPRSYGSGAGLLISLRSEVQLNSPYNETNEWHGVAVPVPGAPARLPHPPPLAGQLGVARTAAASLTSRCSASARPPASEINAAVSAISPASGRRRRLRRLRPQGIERLCGRFPAQRRSQWRLPDLSCGPRLPPWQRRWSGSPSRRPWLLSSRLAPYLRIGKSEGSLERLKCVDGLRVARVLKSPATLDDAERILEAPAPGTLPIQHPK